MNAPLLNSLKISSCFCIYSDTDSASFFLEADSYEESKQYLLTSLVLFAIKEIIDFSSYLPHYPDHRLFQELKAHLTQDAYDKFIVEIFKNSNMPGLLKCENRIAKYSQDMSFFYSIKSKSYVMGVYCDEGDGADNTEVADLLRNNPAQLVESQSVHFKRILKGPILKSRFSSFSVKDFLAMGDHAQSSKFLEKEINKIQSKNWKAYLLSIDRNRPNALCRKRYLVDPRSGLTKPFGM